MNTSKMTERLMEIALLVIVLSLVVQHHFLRENVANTKHRIEMQFSDTEMSIMETKNDLDSIGVMLDRMEAKLDSLNLKK